MRVRLSSIFKPLGDVKSSAVGKVTSAVSRKSATGSIGNPLNVKFPPSFIQMAYIVKPGNYGSGKGGSSN
jgi:hypothetical protein